MRNFTGRRFAIGLAVCWTAVGAMAWAADLPKAETILDRYVEVTGGKAAYEKRKSEVTTGTFELTAMGLKGAMTTYHVAPDKAYTEIEFPGLGKIQEGSNGAVAWQLSAMQGPHLKEGDERATSLLMAKFNGDVAWRDLYKTVETAGVETVDGKPCYSVTLTPKEGPGSTRCYDKESGLLTKAVVTMKGPMGEITVEGYASDYRKEGDLLVPHKMTQKTMGQEFTINIDSVKPNADIPAERFAVPAEIQALIDKKK